jgi:hypothetical protein
VLAIGLITRDRVSPIDLGVGKAPFFRLVPPTHICRGAERTVVEDDVKEDFVPPHLLPEGAPHLPVALVRDEDVHPRRVLKQLLLWVSRGAIRQLPSGEEPLVVIPHTAVAGEL